MYAKPSARVHASWLLGVYHFVAFRGHGFRALRLMVSSLLLVFPVFVSAGGSALRILVAAACAFGVFGNLCSAELRL